MALNLDVVLADLNGTAFAAAGAGEWGFINEEYKLAIPEEDMISYADKYDVTKSSFPSNEARKRFILANYARLTAGGVADVVAIQIVLLRVSLVEHGIIAKAMDERSVIEDEYVSVKPKNADWDDAANAIQSPSYNSNVAKFYKRYGLSFASMMVYVFLSRGHHYKPEYDALYDRLKTACFIPSNPGFPLLSNEQMFRLAIHCFGVKPLVHMVQEMQKKDELPAALHIRFTPHAPISGVAHVTTLMAVITQMSKEPWFDAFDQKFSGHIKVIKDEVDLINAKPMDYHVSAKFLGCKTRLMPRNDTNASFNRLCQFALGYVEHLGRRHSLYGQQAITKKSGGLTGLADAFIKACDKFSKPSTDVDSMRDFLSSV